MNTLILFFFILIDFSVQAAQGKLRERSNVSYTIRSGGFEIFQSPCSYMSLTEIDVSQMTVPVERTYACIDPKAGETVLLTPVSPCVAVIGKNNRENVLCIIHVFYPNKVADIPLILKKNLFDSLDQPYDPSNISITLFSKAVDEEKYRKEWLKSYAGRTQRQHFKYIQETIIDSLGIDKDALHSIFLETGYEGAIPETILINGDVDEYGSLKLYHSNPLEGDLFLQDTQKLYNYVRAITKKNYGMRVFPFHPYNVYRYDTVEFVPVEKNNFSTIKATHSKKRDRTEDLVENEGLSISLKKKTYAPIVPVLFTYIPKPNLSDVALILYYIFASPLGA